MKKKYYLTLFLSLFVLFTVAAQVCNPPTAIGVSTVTQTSANISWASNGETQWEVIVQPIGTPVPLPSQAGIAAASIPFTATGLTPCTLYQFYVRTVCAPGVTSNWTGPFNFSTGSNLSCTATVSGSTVTMNTTGGSVPYQFSVNGGPFQPSGVFANMVTPGNYTFQVRDANGCTCTSMVTINPSGFSVSIGSTLDTPTSNLFAIVNGGIGPFTYQWGLNGMLIAGATTENLFILGNSGQYSLTVTDANGLTATATYFVEGMPISANVDSFNIYPVNGGPAVSSVSVLANDFVNGMPANTTNAVLTPLDIPSGFSLNPDGTVSVLPGTPSGTYQLMYRIAVMGFPIYYDSGIAVVTVINEGIFLNAFIDTNNNGTQEAGEPNFNQGQFGYEMNDSGIVHHVTSQNGEYLINESNPANSYDLTYAIDPAYALQYTVSPSSYSNVSVVLNSGAILYNFPITIIPFTDLSVYVSQLGAPPRPGFTYVNLVRYTNNGNQPIASGTLTFSKDNAVSFTNVSPAATTTAANGFTYNFTNLLPGHTEFIFVTMQVPTIPTVALGNILTNTASITIPPGDIYPLNNNSSLSQMIMGSYDPNDKAEAHGGKIIHSDFTANDYLTYTIQFENTGTFHAENVRVNDVLDAKLDETSVRMIDASHGYTLNRVGNNLNWELNGIELQPLEKGYINFQVKPKPGYAVGDIIPNTASIFFDFNPAIVTNTVTTEFVVNLGVDSFENGAFAMYPNPTDGLVTISLKNNSEIIDAITVTNILGKTVQSKTTNSPVAQIDLSQLSGGIYFVKVKAGQQEKIMKIIRE